MTSMSVAHTAIASTRTRTSVGPGSGTGFSTTDSSSGPPRTQAFMLAGMGYWLPREPASGCGLAMVLPSYAVAADFGSARAGVNETHDHGPTWSPCPGNPNIGKILADEMARRDVPAHQL